ncbi:MAG: T9SS type A sorting domain-containing protein [Bacteroidia bacterium]|nr:T9SS type A sorting domain-containing protein [Bacteroidia bacterium]
MKKLLLSVAFLMSVTFVMSQAIERTQVVLEKGTGTWCVWCPSAAQGCEDLLEAGAPVAVVSNHYGDSYQNQYSSSRNSMYAISGYPTAVFDGKQKVVGGSSSGTTIGMYAPVVQSHMAEMCAVDVELEVEVTDATYDLTVTLTKLDAITASDLRLIIFVTESHIPQNWFSMTEVNHVNRLMVPDQNGTVVDFSSGDVQVVNLSFNWTTGWVEENSEFVVCLQNADAGQPGGGWVKSILNGIKQGVIDLIADFEGDVTSIEVGDPVSFTSEYSGGYIGPVPVTYHWEFPGATPDTSNEANPTVTYTESGYHDVTFTINKGGQILDILKEDYIYVAPGVGVSDPSAVSAVNCYPNPSNGHFRVEIFMNEPALVDLEVVNTMNSIVYQERGISVNEQIIRNLDLDLASGVYFLVIRDGNRKQIRKLVIL